jgi:hypothetical protein
MRKGQHNGVYRTPAVIDTNHLFFLYPPSNRLYFVYYLAEPYVLGDLRLML